jgi:hypothetical protein
MIFIEVKRIVKESIIIVIVFLGLLLAMLLTDKEFYIAPAMEVFLIMYASFTGWSMFERERQEGAMEYLLSLPISRSRLFLLKWIPRAVAIAIVLAGYHFIHRPFAMHFLLPYFDFVLFALTVFLLSIALSVSMKSFLGTFFITLFLAVGLYYFIRFLDYSLKREMVALQAALSLLVIPLLFFVLFHKFDIKPISYFNKKYVPLLILTVLVIFGVTFLTTGSKWFYFYPARDGSVFMVFEKRTVVNRGDSEGFILEGPVYPLYEQNGEIYASRRESKKAPEQLVRIDPESGHMITLYAGEPGWWFHSGGYPRVTMDSSIYLLLTGKDHREYRILEVRDNQTRIIPVKVDLEHGEYIHFLSGGSAEPLQFMVFTDYEREFEKGRLFRIFADGQAELLKTAENVGVWKNRVLAFEDSKMTLYELGQDLKEISTLPGEFKKVRRRFENYNQKKVLVRRDNLFYAFDLEAETLERVDIGRLPYQYQLSPEGGLRIVWVEDREISVSQFIDGHLQTEKIWFSDIEGFKIVQVFASGVVVRGHKKWEIFRFEDDGGGDNYGYK